MADDLAALPSGLIGAVEAQSAVLFLGAAASYGARHPRGAEIPSAPKLRDMLSDKFLRGELKDKVLSSVAEYAASETNLIAVQGYIREIFQEFGPAPFHQLVAHFRWHGLATTNYDLVLERAYEAGNAPLQELVPFVKDGQLVETQMKKAVDGVQFLKLHGSIDHYLDKDIPFVLAIEQYARYAKNRTRLFERLRDWGREFPIIFCGYSISDPHIQSILFQLFDLQSDRPMYYLVDPEITEVEARYWAGHRVTPIRLRFKDFMERLDAAVAPASKILPRAIGGGTSTLRTHYKITAAPESKALFCFLADDVEHIRPGMPIVPASAPQFYRGADDGWGAIESGFDVLRAVTDSLVVDAVLSSEDERPGRVDFYAVKGPGGNGKTIVLKRAAWMAAHDYNKIVLFVRRGGSIRPDVIEEIYRYVQERIFLFVDRAAFFVDDLHRVVDLAKSQNIRLTVIVAERDAEWNVRCKSLERYAVQDYPVRYLSEKEIRDLLEKLEEHHSLGLLREISNFEDRVKRLMGGAQRQLLVALHEATLGKAFEEIVFEEYHRITPNDAQDLYMDICTLNRLGVDVRAGLIARVSGIKYLDFEKRLFKPLEYIVKAGYDKYISDWVYSARHQHVAEMVFDRVLPDAESRYDQIIQIINGMNIDYSSDRAAFSQLVRGHGVSEALRSRELGRAFFEAAARLAPNEAFLFQQRAIFEMEPGGDLSLAEKHLERAAALEPRSHTIQHSLAVLGRRQALTEGNSLLRQRLRDRAKARIAPQLGLTAENTYGYHIAAQITLDEIRDTLAEMVADTPEPTLERRLVELARDFERYVQEGLQMSPQNEHLLALKSEYRDMLHQHGPAELALKRAFDANPRQEWIAIRLARTLELAGRHPEAKQVLIRCLQDNPSSKRVHYELAFMYMTEKDADRNIIFDHLRRSFTTGDQNYEAQFWYAREAFITGKYPEAFQVFQSLSRAPVTGQQKNQIRGILSDDDDRARVFVGEVITIEDAYMFVRCPDFPDNVFIHRSRINDEHWRQIRRGKKILFTLGFNMRGPSGASASPSA